MFIRKTVLLGGSALFALGIVAAAQSAAAQTTSTTPPPPPSTTPPPSTATTVEGLVVTGSRIPKAAYTAAAPITVMSNSTAVLEGLADTATLLQQQPIASGSFQVNGLLGSYVNTGGPGAETISLRGLGAQRTLVLLNGRRLGPAGVRGTVGPVDLNVIPNSILDRTEIYKDGASSIYGSDAVAGVVNFITKKNVDGGEMSVFGDSPTRPGGGEYEINGDYGKTYDKGYFTISADYSVQEELTNGQRSYTACAKDLAFDPVTHADIDFIDPTTGTDKCDNVLTGSAEAATVYGGVFQYAVPGITYPSAADGNNIAATFPALQALGFIRAGRAGHPATEPYLNDDSPLYARTTAITPYQRGTVFFTGGYDLTPKTEVYSEVLLNQRDTQNHGYQQLFPTVDANNPNNPFTDINNVKYAALPLVAFPEDSSQSVKYGRAVVGFKGSLGDGLPVIKNWNWDIYGQASDSDGTYKTQFAYNDRINAVTGPTGCDTSLITISPVVACPNGAAGIPFFSQRFLAGQFTPAEEAFLFGSATGTTKYLQQAVEGNLTGNLFDLPAGAVGANFGFDVRHDSIDDEPSYEERKGNFYNLSAAAPTKGDDTVTEVYGELNVPILKGEFFAKNLSAELSGRYTDYKSYGSNSTYKVGLNWEITPSIRLAGTLGTSFRAPDLYELYLGDQTSFLAQTQIDPCINYQNSPNTNLRNNCAAAGVPTMYTGAGGSSTITAAGSKGLLKAETSLADTISLTWSPSFADLKVDVDYFDITVSNEIEQFGPGNILFQCYTSTIYPTDPFCSLFTRDNNPASASYHGILNVNDNYVNLAQEVNRGVDLDVSYKKKVAQIQFVFDGQFTWQFQDKVTELHGSIPIDFNGTTVEPAFTAQIQTKATYNDWTFFWNVEMFGKASDTGLPGFNYTDIQNAAQYGLIPGSATTGIPVYYKQYTDFTAYHSFSLQRKLDKWTITGGIQNAFDTPPPQLSGDEAFRDGVAALNAYDLLGRRFFLRFDKKF